MNSSKISVTKRCTLAKAILKKKWSARTHLMISSLISKFATGATLEEKEASREQVAEILMEALEPVADEAEAPAVLEEVQAGIQSMRAVS